MGKFRNYANSVTSINNRGKEKDKSPKANLKPTRDVDKTSSQDASGSGNAFVDDINRGSGLKTPEDKAQEYMNNVLHKVVDANTPADARSNSSYYATVDVSNARQREIALVEQLSMINALPPIPDNIVDPPPIWEQSLLKTDLTSWGGGVTLIGKDYLQRVIARGQFLTLVPIDIVPKLLGNVTNDVASFAKKLNFVGLLDEAGKITLDKLNTRLNVASYGLNAKVNSLKYYKAVNAHMKTALLSLGIDYDLDANINTAEIENLKRYLPKEIVSRLIGNASPVVQSIQERFKGPGNAQNASSTGVDNANLSNAWQANLQNEDANADKIAGFVKTDTTGEDFVRKANYVNLLKYVTNIDQGDEVIKTLPFACFYCNGPIEKGMSTSNSMGESAVSAMTTDIGAKGWKNLTDNSATLSNIASGSEDYIKEMAYHRNLGAFLVSNTYIPNVIKSSMIDFQYTVNIRDVTVSSDRYSIARLMWTLSQLFPFVIQTNDPGSSLIVPSAPMYCSAFSKGVMNLPRAAITNLSIKSSPEFQTTEGIPTELDITLTIQPLFSQTVMPNFDKFYDGTKNPEYLASAMFNPLSSFNIIATLCGQNTILTKFQAGLFSFFIGGSLTTFFKSIKDTGMVVSSSWKDWWSSASLMRNEVYSRTRLIGV